MNGNYQTAKFLANERINDQLALARQYRQAQAARNGRDNRDGQVTMPNAAKRVTVMVVQLATAIRSLGNAMVAAR